MNKLLLLLGCVLALALLGLYAWQKSEEDSYASDAEDHLAAASQIRSAEADGVAAGALLQQYVATGDESVLPQMQSLTDSGVRKLTAGITAAGGDPNGFVQQGSGLVQSAGQVIALRQSGDVAGATAALNALSEEFVAFIAAQDEFVAGEQARAAAANSSADDAESLARIFGASSALVLLATGAGAALMLRHRMRRQEAAGAASA